MDAHPGLHALRRSAEEAVRHKYCFEVPGDPRPKKRPRFGQGRAYRTDRTDEAVVAWHARAVFGDRRLEGDVALRVEFYRARKKGRQCDIDNLLKLVLDGLNGVAWRDDSQVREVEMSLRYSDNPRTLVELWEVAA